VILIFALAGASVVLVIAGLAYALYDASRPQRPRLCKYGNPGQSLCLANMFDNV
jgi:hypothetical protein